MEMPLNTLPTHLIHSKLPLGALKGIYDKVVLTGKKYCCMQSSPYHLPRPPCGTSWVPAALHRHPHTGTNTGLSAQRATLLCVEHPTSNEVHSDSLKDGQARSMSAEVKLKRRGERECERADHRRRVLSSDQWSLNSMAVAFML